MKHFKRFSALLLVLVLALSLAACGKNEAEALYGTWTVHLDMSDTMNDTLSETGLDADIMEGLSDLKLEFLVHLSFDEEGYTMSLDQEATEKALEDYFVGLQDLMVEYLYQTFENEGLSKEDADELFLDSYHMGVEDFVSSLFDEIRGSVDLTAEVEDEAGLYAVEDGKIWFGSTEEELNSKAVSVEYQMDGDTLTMDHPQGNALSLDAVKDLLPLVFER